MFKLCRFLGHCLPYSCEGETNYTANEDLQWKWQICSLFINFHLQIILRAVDNFVNNVIRNIFYGRRFYIQVWKTPTLLVGIVRSNRQLLKDYFKILFYFLGYIYDTSLLKLGHKLKWQYCLIIPIKKLIVYSKYLCNYPVYITVSLFTYVIIHFLFTKTKLFHLHEFFKWKYLFWEIPSTRQLFLKIVV